MKKTFDGIVVLVKMQNTAVVEIVRKTPHPMYKKLLKSSKKYKADFQGIEVSTGDTVRIVETKPLSKDKHFKIEKVLKKGEKK